MEAQALTPREVDTGPPPLKLGTRHASRGA